MGAVAGSALPAAHVRISSTTGELTGGVTRAHAGTKILRFDFVWNSFFPDAIQTTEEEEAPAKKEQTHFTVKLTELKAAEKVKLIKEVKNCIQGLNLVQVGPIDVWSILTLGFGCVLNFSS